MHWVVITGLRGYMPDNVYGVQGLHDAIESALDYLELEKKRYTKIYNILKRDKFYQFDDVHEFGMEYIEIMKCNCDDIKIHNM